jgi:glucokinase
MVSEAARNNQEIKAIGVGCPGIVDDKGIVSRPPNFPKWDSENLMIPVRQTANVPVWVENDGNVAALAEGTFGAGKQFANFILMTLGTGVGGGIVLNNILYKGHGFAAGEIGHIIVFPEGKQCNCGARGCLERYVGIAGINELAQEKLSLAKTEGPLMRMIDHDYSKLSPWNIEKAANKGDEIAAAVLRETGTILGYAASTLANILNIEAIIIAGGVAEAGTYLLEPMKETFMKNTLSIPREQCAILPAALRKRTGVIGAAALAIREYSATSPSN